MQDPNCTYTRGPQVLLDIRPNVGIVAMMSGRRLYILVAASLVLSGVSLMILAILPAPGVPYFKDPLRGLLAAGALIGVGYPLCVAGGLIRKNNQSSPYFEGLFIANFLSLFGYICITLAVLCSALGLYTLGLRLISP